MKQDLDSIFEALKKKILPYSKKLQVISDLPNRYELTGKKEYEVKSLKTGKVTTRKNAYFVGIVKQKNYVGFYFMPPYSEKNFMTGFSKDLCKILKGGSCFHFKTLESVTPEVNKLLKKGFVTFKKNGII